jgi:hypothetical protein
VHPERCCALSFHFQEEHRGNGRDSLYNMFAEKEPGNWERGTGTDHLFCVCLVCGVYWECDRCFLKLPPHVLEGLAPAQQLTVPSGVSKEPHELQITAWC